MTGFPAAGTGCHGGLDGGLTKTVVTGWRLPPRIGKSVGESINYGRSSC